MAQRSFDTGWTLGKMLVEIAGSFGTNGASNPLASSVKGLGFGYSPVNGAYALRPAASPGISSTPGIVHAATGQYNVTFEDSYRDVNVVGVDLQVPSAGPNWAQPGPMSNVGVGGLAPTLQFFTINAAGAAVDIAANAASRVMFSVQFRDSTVGFQKP